MPLEHTELIVGPFPWTRRHFIEVFAWTPLMNPGNWTLSWRVFEVIEDRIVNIHAGTLLEVPGPQRPTLSAFDIRQIARLRVTDDGEAELAVLAGPYARSEIIETEAERQEVREQARAREVADAQVDWKVVRDPTRPPKLTYSDADGCGNLFVYGWSADRTEAIAVRANQEMLQVPPVARTFDVAVQPDLDVAVHVFERPVRRPFCTDVHQGTREEVWTAGSGLVTLQLPTVIRGRQSPARVMIRIVGAEFVNAAGVRVKQTSRITLTATLERLQPR